MKALHMPHRARLLAVPIIAILLSLVLPAGPAQAGIADRWGFAFADQEANAAWYPTARQWGSWKVNFPGEVARARKVGVGQYEVLFPRLASERGVVHVTAVGRGAFWCQTRSWGPLGADLLIKVACHKDPGNPLDLVDAQFTVLFSESSQAVLPAPQAYGYIFADQPAAMAYQPPGYNSAAGINQVTKGAGQGFWQVRLGGFGSAGLSGNVQVTAVDPQKPARCKVARWTQTAADQLIYVRCYTTNNQPFDTKWTLTYQRQRSIFGTTGPAPFPSMFAYTFNNQPNGAVPYVPLPPPINFNSSAAVNTVDRPFLPINQMNFSNVGIREDHVQVTAFGSGAAHCHIYLWLHAGTTAQVQTMCADGLGNVLGFPSLPQSLVSHTSRL